MFRLRLVHFGGVTTIEENIRDLSGVLDSVGFFLVSVSQRAFAEQGNPPGSWPARRVPNIAGVISDLRHSSRIKDRRFDPRPALVDTGELRRSVWWETHQNGVTIGSYGPAQAYADVQHSGGESETEEITSDVVKRLREWLQRDAGARLKRAVEASARVRAHRQYRDAVKGHGLGKAALREADANLKAARKAVRTSYSGTQIADSEWENDLGWIAQTSMIGKKIPIKVRPRPWLDYSAEDREDLTDLIPEAIMTPGGRVQRGGGTIAWRSKP